MTEKFSVSLIDCPFCGGAVKYGFNPSHDANGQPCHYIHCVECPAVMEVFNCPKELVITAWNKRAKVSQCEIRLNEMPTHVNGMPIEDIIKMQRMFEQCSGEANYPKWWQAVFDAGVKSVTDMWKCVEDNCIVRGPHKHLDKPKRKDSEISVVDDVTLLNLISDALLDSDRRGVGKCYTILAAIKPYLRVLVQTDKIAMDSECHKIFKAWEDTQGGNIDQTNYEAWKAGYYNAQQKRESGEVK